MIHSFEISFYRTIYNFLLLFVSIVSIMHKELAQLIREAFIPIFKAYDLDGNSTWEKK